MNKDSLNRYTRCGGLDALIRRYERGDISLEKGAELAGCSRGTFCKDIVRYLGPKGFTLLRNNRRKVITSPTLDILKLKTFFAERLKSLSKNEGQKLQTIIYILEQAERAGVLLAGIKGRGRKVRFFISPKKTLKIRMALANYQQPEHQIGLHRFRVTPAISKYDFAIFAIRNDNNTTIYIFKTSEISGIQSLALRFEWFERNSTYEYARDRWSILAK